MTIRDLRSALAYVITNDRDPDAHEPMTPPWRGAYWNTLFSTPSATDLVLGELQWLDPARFAHPNLERFLFFRHRPEDAPDRARLFANGEDLPAPAGNEPAELTAWIDAFKRRLVLEGVRNAEGMPFAFDPLALLPYRMASEMTGILAGNQPVATLLPRILRGIGRSEGIEAARVRDDLVLRVKRSDAYAIEIVKQFPTDQFSLTVDDQVGNPFINTIPRTLRLAHRASGAAVRLNLDLVDLLARLADGLDPTSQELGPLLEELLPFKSRVQRSASDQLLVIEGGRTHQLARVGGAIVRTSAGQPGRSGR
jgi:hypothetical protein